MIARLVLASRSPRRRELLLAAGLDNVTVVPSAAAESGDPSSGLASLVLHNARMKAAEVAPRHPESVVLGADTLVWLDGDVLGKPQNPAEAARMLSRLSGRAHEVCTGVSLLRLSPHKQVEFHETTRVRFRKLSPGTIADYLAKVDVLDKAGSYALQEHGEMLVEAVEGSRSNVVGLPVERTLAALRRFAGED